MTEPKIKIDHVTYAYASDVSYASEPMHEDAPDSGASHAQNGAGRNGVRDISLSIAEGECVVLCGESGCGKTTITRLINGLIPHYYEGTLCGSVQIDGADVSAQPLYETAKKVGSVFQNPRSQFFNVDTTSEITFGCENLGMPEAQIRENLGQTIHDFRLERLMDRSIFELSGGEKQKIACAGAAMMQPDIYVLDEPSSNLDVSSIMDLRQTLRAWKEQGKTIVISEHRLYYLRGIADRFVYLKDGEIAGEYSPEEFAQLSEELRQELGLRAFSLGQIKPKADLMQMRGQMELHGFRFGYKGGTQVLHIGDCSIPAHGIVGIIGNNGAGKSTFSRCLCGLEKRCGEVIRDGKTYRPKDRLNTCYMVMQEVNHQLFTESVLDEVMISMEQENEPLAKQILQQLDLGAYMDRHPMSLSGGQKQRVAIASAIASHRSMMVFDEPTSGLDNRHMKEVAQVLRQLHAEGISLYIITHDVELVMECCTDIVHIENGAIKEQYPMDVQGIAKILQYFQVG